MLKRSELKYYIFIFHSIHNIHTDRNFYTNLVVFFALSDVPAFPVLQQASSSESSKVPHSSVTSNLSRLWTAGSDSTLRLDASSDSHFST